MDRRYSGIVTMKRDGRIMIFGMMVGRWVLSLCDWRDKWGVPTKQLKCYHGFFINGDAKKYCFTRRELKEWIIERYEVLASAYHSMNDMDAEAAILRSVGLNA